jgi:hypothetical protein
METWDVWRRKTVPAYHSLDMAVRTGRHKKQPNPSSWASGA